jgi:hypothetical protein
MVPLMANHRGGGLDWLPSQEIKPQQNASASTQSTQHFSFSEMILLEM